jgi:hypothetical protein
MGPPPAVAAARLMAARKTLTDDAIAAIRQRSREGVSDARIAAEFKISRSTVAYWRNRAPEPEPRYWTPRSQPGQIRRSRKSMSRKARMALVNRLWRAAEGQVREIEDRLFAREHDGAEAGDTSARERDARMLAVLVKTLRELAALDQANDPAANSNAAGAAQAEPEDDDPVPRDIDEFRRELARRIQTFVGNEHGGTVPGDDQ